MEFRLPIEYGEDVKRLDGDATRDLEILSSVSVDAPLVDVMLGRRGAEWDSGGVRERMATTFTTDAVFLKEMAGAVAAFGDSWAHDFGGEDHADRLIAEVVGMSEPEFCETFMFLPRDLGLPVPASMAAEVAKLAGAINASEPCQRAAHVYRTVHPLTYMLMPVFLLFLPFVVLVLQGSCVTFGRYVHVMWTQVLPSHDATRLFTDFWRMSWAQCVQSVLTTGLFLYSLYGNAVNWFAHQSLRQRVLEIDAAARRVLRTGEGRIRRLIEAHKCLTASAFVEHLCAIRQALPELPKTAGIGCEFAALHTVYRHREAMRALLDVGIYHHAIQHLNMLPLTAVAFGGGPEEEKGDKEAKGDTEAEEATKEKIHVAIDVVGLRFPFLHRAARPHTLLMDRDVVVTGKNGTGKTTFLKSVFLNVLVAQQFGVAFADSMRIRAPFAHLHCTINIPDTSARDSLFQAEAARCKRIADLITSSSPSPSTPSAMPPCHLCIFDELFSGTNPVDATDSSAYLLAHLAQQPHALVLVSTHYPDIDAPHILRVKTNDRHDILPGTERETGRGLEIIQQQLNLVSSPSP